MNFHQLRQLVNELTDDQLVQKIFFIELNSPHAIHEPELRIAQEPILAFRLDAELEGDDRAFAQGMPYLG